MNALLVLSVMVAVYGAVIGFDPRVGSRRRAALIWLAASLTAYAAMVLAGAPPTAIKHVWAILLAYGVVMSFSLESARIASLSAFTLLAASAFPVGVVIALPSQAGVVIIYFAMALAALFAAMTRAEHRGLHVSVYCWSMLLLAGYSGWLISQALPHALAATALIAVALLFLRLSSSVAGLVCWFHPTEQDPLAHLARHARFKPLQPWLALPWFAACAATATVVAHHDDRLVIAFAATLAVATGLALWHDPPKTLPPWMRRDVRRAATAGRAPT